MHILLTDVLSCPRCGPDFGLILLADALDARRVREGRLGCPNCRTEYPIRSSVADLRLGEAGATAVPVGGEYAERALRLAVLLGVVDQQGIVLISGADPDLVAEVARHLPEAEVFGGSSTPLSDGPVPGQSWILHGAILPIRSGSLRGIALVGEGPVALAEAARALVPGGRLVVEGTTRQTADAVAEAGLTLMLEQDGMAVASRPTGR